MTPHATWLVGAAALVSLLAVAGCGEKGPPRPPEPRGPFPPDRVNARQVGPGAFIGFVVPVARGDKAGQQPVRVELIRVSYSPDVEPTLDANSFRRRGEVVNTLDGDPLKSGTTMTISDPRCDVWRREGPATRCGTGSSCATAAVDPLPWSSAKTS